MKVVVEVSISKKSGNQYAALVADLGYRKAYLSFDTNLIAEILNCSVRDVFDLDIGTYNVE